MDVRTVPLGDVNEADESRWHALAGRALEPNPALEPEGLRAAAAHLPDWRRLPLLQVTDGDDLVLCALARPVRRWRRGPLPTLTSRPEDGAIPLFVVLGTPLADPVRARPAIAALLSALKSGEVRPHGQRARLVTVDRWRLDGGVAAAWNQACLDLSLPVATYGRWERPILVREEAQRDGWPASLGARRVAELERRRARLGQRVGPVVVRDRSADPAAVDELVRMEGAGWKGQANTALAADAARTDAFREACRRWAADGRLTMLSLEAGGAQVAIRCAVRSGDGFFLFKSAYDQRYARYAPGLLLHLATAEHFLSTDAGWMDSCCAPSNTFFPTLLPHRLAVATSTTGLDVTGRATVRAVPFASAASRLRRRARRAAAVPASNSLSGNPPVASTVEDTERRSG